MGTTVPLIDRLNSIPQVLEKVPVSRSRLFQLLRDGSLGSVRIGGRRFVKDSQIAAYIDSLG